MTIRQTLMAAFTVAFFSSALLVASSVEAPEQPANIEPIALKGARLAVLEANPWQGMSDTDLMTGVVYEPIMNQYEPTGE